MIYPKLFDFIPKEMMIKGIKQQVEDTTVAQISLENNQINKISKVFKYEEIQYALIQYEYDMIISMEDDAEKSQFMLEMMQAMHGKKNVTVREDDKLQIHLKRKAYAINDPAIGTWKFLEKKKLMEELTEKILPKKVMKKLK